MPYTSSYYQLFRNETTTYVVNQVATDRLQHAQPGFDTILTSLRLTPKVDPENDDIGDTGAANLLKMRRSGASGR